VKDSTSKYDVDWDEEIGTLEDIEKLLTLAEELQDKCDQADMSVKRSRMWQIIFTVISSIGVVILLLWGSSQSKHFTFWMGIALLTFVIIYINIGGFENFIQHSKSHKSRDQRALYQIVELLREIEGALARKGNWSTLDRAQFRIRLSRFDIGPSSRRF
jgi:hypothetical protein